MFAKLKPFLENKTREENIWRLWRILHNGHLHQLDGNSLADLNVPGMFSRVGRIFVNEFNILNVMLE